MAYIFLTIAFSLNAIANILLKFSARKGLAFSSSQPLSSVLDNWQLLAGIGCFALNVVFYYLSLRSLPVSTAYPVMVVTGFVIVNGYAAIVFGESMTLLTCAGYGLIVLGLILVLVRTV